MPSWDNKSEQGGKAMKNLIKAKEVLNFVVASAAAIVALADLWERVGPEIKKVLKPVLESCKRITSDSTSDTLAIAESK